MTTTTSVPVAGPPDPPLVRLSRPGDLVAATPYLLRFHPTDSLVMLAFGGVAGTTFAGIARTDLPAPEHVGPLGRTLVETMRRRGASAVAILGYGPAERVDQRRVAPVGGLTRTSMDQATRRAETRLAGWLDTVPEAERQRAVLGEGAAVVRAAIDRSASGGALDDDAVAWLTILLTWLPVRDAAWQAITAEQPHLTLWTDVVRRADPALVPAPACLLAFTAWRFGDGVLAGMALERAERADPDYPLAGLLRRLLAQGPPGPEFADWGTPAWDRRMGRITRRPRRRKV